MTEITTTRSAFERASALAGDAHALSSGYLVRTHGKRAADYYRRAAALVPGTYDATRWLDLAEWCEGQQGEAVAR